MVFKGGSMDRPVYRPDRTEEIEESLFENGISVYDERLKQRIMETLNRLPEEDQDFLLYEKVIRIIQPVANTVIELNGLNLSIRDNSGKIVIMAFESGLCDRPPSEVIYFIAHEFAHVFLGHATNQGDSGDECEIKADEQALRWGFGEELRSSSFNYIYKKGL